MSPAELIKEEIKLWLQENNFYSNNLLERIPKRWELLGNLVLLPSSSFMDNEWQTILKNVMKNKLNVYGN